MRDQHSRCRCILQGIEILLAQLQACGRRLSHAWCEGTADLADAAQAIPGFEHGLFSDILLRFIWGVV